MAGTRTAGTVDGTPLYIDLSLHWIDASGDMRSDSYQVDPTATAAEIEAYAAAQQAASNASLWKIVVGGAYSSVPNANQAATASHNSADDVINMLTKTAGNMSQNVVVRAPLQTLFVGDTEEIDVTDALLATLSATWLVIADGTYTAVSFRFTERREIGRRQRI